MSAKSKVRGSAVERWLVQKHKERGIPAERVPLSGAIGGEYIGDIAIPSVRDREFTGESKARKNGEGFKVIEKWMQNKNILFVKRNHQDPLVVLPFELYLQLMGKYYEPEDKHPFYKS